MNQEMQRLHRMVGVMEREDEPLAPALEDRLVHAVLGDLRAQRARRRSLIITGAGAATALAACLLLYLSFSGPGELPGFGMEVTSTQVLGAPSAAGAEPTRLSPRSSLDVRLRPQRDPGVPVAARAFLGQGGAASPLPLELPLEVTQRSGAVRLRAPVSALPGLAGQRGRRELLLVVGPAASSGSLPDAAAVAQALRALPQRGPAGALRKGEWQILWHPLELTE